jgi:membrane protease YdiL (CAAX protease family)
MIARQQWEAIGEVALCSGVPTQLALAGIARLAGLQPQSPDGTLSLGFVATIALGDTAVLGILILTFLKRRGESARDIFFAGRRPWRDTLLGLLLVPVLLVFISATMWLLRTWHPALRNVPDNPLEAMARTVDGAAVLLVVSMIGGGVREEFQRAFLIHRFRTHLGGAANGLILTSLGFGLGHGLQGWDAMIVTGLLGLFWGVLYLARRSITTGLVSHGLTNAAQVVVSYLQRPLG